ncbi:MAG: hydroxyphenylacetyl-CoA thioesterase PaaI [Bacteriovoracia bacterium]
MNESVKKMLEHDRFSQWLGLNVESVADGQARVSMTIKEDMLNGFAVVHGGVLFALADSAFAFACNSRDNLSLALDAVVSFIKKASLGDVITAQVEEVHNGKTTGVYEVKLTNQKNELVAQFRGTAIRTGKSVIKGS